MANSSDLAYFMEDSDHKTDMMNAFDDYLQNESMVDVMLSCEGRTIKAHKMVLSAGSTYFKNIFGAFKNPFQFPVLIIKDMPFLDLKAIVEFLYRGEVMIPMKQISSLKKSAQTLYIKGLEKHFNTSAMVNVQTNPKTTSNANTLNAQTNTEVKSSSRQTKQNSINSKKSKVKPKKESKRSIAMRLRNNQRPDYKQLSNGYFNSDDDNSEIEFNGYASYRLSQTSDPKPSKTNGRNSEQNSRRIKSELIYEMTDNSNENQNTDMLSVPENSDDSDIDGDDNHSDIICESGIDYIQIRDRDESQLNTLSASTSKSMPSLPMPPLTRKPMPIINTQRNRRKTISTCNSKNRSQNIEDIKMPALRPNKIEPEKVGFITCSLCPRIFAQLSSLRNHMKVHRIHEEKQTEHNCHLCGKKYSWRSGLYKHMKTHKN